MTVRMLAAVGEPAVEAALIAALARPGSGVEVTRRCVDLADLLAAAAAGAGQVAVVSSRLPRFDRAAVTRLQAAGTAVLGLFADEQDERALRALGVGAVLPLTATPGQVTAAVLTLSEAHAADAGWDLGDPAGSLRPFPPAAGRAGSGAAAPGRDAAAADPVTAGMVIAVWGPVGSPGRTTVATNLAAELALLGTSVVLIDADVYGGSVAQLLGLLDESAGLAAAARAANAGTLDVPALAALARPVAMAGAAAGGGLQVLTGLSRAERWPELRPASVVRVLELCRLAGGVTVVDCAFCLEQDEELSFDVAAPRRNGATLAVLADADLVLAVGAADPIGLARLVRGLAELAEVVPGPAPRVLVNRVRSGPVPGDPAREIPAALSRFAGVQGALLLPEDRDAVDAGLARGRVLAECAPGSPLRLALRELAAGLSDRPVGRVRRRGLSRRSA